jgi:hypothetical protein
MKIQRLKQDGQLGKTLVWSPAVVFHGAIKNKGEPPLDAKMLLDNHQIIVTRQDYERLKAWFEQKGESKNERLS